MTTWHLSCRAHGGVFTMESRKGRKPVRCTTTTVKCTKHPGYVVEQAEAKATTKLGSQAVAIASKIKSKRIKERMVVVTEPSRVDTKAAEWEKNGKPKLKEKGGKRDLRTTVQKPAEVKTTVNPGLPLAQKAKEALIAKGWTVTGRSWAEPVEENSDASHVFASINASRDDEHLLMVWRNGILITQDYQLWKNGHLPQANNRPSSELDFDPDEVSDKELTTRLMGKRIQWWNKLGAKKEEATVGDRVRVSHTFIGRAADENPGERIITVVDQAGGFRSFHASALVKVWL